MSYRVVWRRRLADRVHTYAFSVHERGGNSASVAPATQEIDLLLSDDPVNVGESRSGGERVLIVHPVSVFYEVFEDARVVMIYAAVFYPRIRG